MPSWPQHWHIDRMEASFRKLARTFLQLWLRLKRGAQKRIGSRQILGQVLSSTENVDITSLRGSGSANPFSCALPFGLGALPPLTRLGNRVQSALQARFLHSVAKQAAKAAQADRRSWLRRQATSIQADLDNGVSTSLWSFVRYLSKNKARRGPKPAVTPQGDIASSFEDLARVWQGTFFREIDRREEIIPKCAYVPFASQMLDTTTPPPVVDAPVCLTFFLRLWMPFRKLRLEKPLVPTSFLLSFSRQAAARFVCFFPDCFPKLLITELRQRGDGVKTFPFPKSWTSR